MGPKSPRGTRDWRNRQHFFAIAGRVMRRYLIDYARRRPVVEFVPLEGMIDSLPDDTGRLDLGVTFDRLLDQLDRTKPEWCQLVEVKYFLGLSDEEPAESLGMKMRTIQRMWRDARQWLFEQTETQGAEQSAGH